MAHCVECFCELPDGAGPLCSKCKEAVRAVVEEVDRLMLSDTPLWYGVVRDRKRLAELIEESGEGER